jgi:hypothetical protein
MMTNPFTCIMMEHAHVYLHLSIYRHVQNMDCHVGSCVVIYMNLAPSIYNNQQGHVTVC